MSNAAIAERPTVTVAPTVTVDQMELVKRTIANGATAEELKLYLYDCARQGVHPLDKLLHFTKRGGKYTPVTSIDLMRIRAAETGEMAGSDDARFVDEDEKHPFSATVKVYRLTQGQRFPYEATAYWSEYYPGDQGGHMWKKMPHTMLAKCAEALALRKGFPRQLAGLYAAEELDQANHRAPSGGSTEAISHGPATSVVPSVPNGGEIGHSIIDTNTGEERPAPPSGYSYITNYSLKNGWHEFTVLNYMGQGHPFRLSTKKDIGFAAERASAEGIPIKFTTSPKRNAVGEAYVNTIELWDVDPDDPDGWTATSLPPEPISSDDIPF